MKRFATLLALIAILAMVLPAYAQGPEKSVYLVQMVEAPVVAYEGDVQGIPATKPGKGAKINPKSGPVKKYVGYLDSRHDAALNDVGVRDSKIYSYHYTFNGFAAVLTSEQAAALAKQPGVINVWADEQRYLATDASPDFLGLTGDGGLWEDYTGEDVIIGVIDTGIWPEHPSFSDQIDLADRPGESGKGTRAYGPPPADWYGGCTSGEQISQDDCNNKLVGIRHFLDGAQHSQVIPDDYKSGRDRDGHGTHTASTAGGNRDVPASIFGIDRSTVSGIAPRARIAAYKACWNDAGCWLSDLVQSIDTAVADGVDVINYSIGSSSTLLGPDDISFLFAADAGVYVATSAGNSGPDPSTIGSPAWTPWITAVGANTHHRAFISDITVMAPGAQSLEIWGGSVTPGVDDYNLVDAVGIPDMTGDASGECLNPFTPGTFQPNDAVLCNPYNFGVPRVERVAHVAAGGGGAVIFLNSETVSVLPTDNHVLPTVHVGHEFAQPVKDYLSAHSDVTVSFTQGQARYAPGDARVKPAVMASFSSRGPNGGAMDIIKPDITAPGISILAGNTPNPWGGAPGQLFQSIMGTSMSSPHVAGVFALLKEAHPDWSAAQAKSAIMTTAYQQVWKEDGVTPADLFDMGAGHVQPNPAADPGLVYDAGFFDYLAFLCGNNPANIGQGTCDFLASLGYSWDPSQLNQASIGIGALAGTETVRRTVTNVGPDGTYNVSVDAPPGIDVVVSPASLTLAPGDSTNYEVTFTVTESASLNDWATGSLTWSHGPHNVRSPIAVRPVALAAPDEVMGTGTEGSSSFDVVFGYSGAYTAAPHGLVSATVTSDNVLQDPDQSFDPNDGYSNPHTFDLSGVANFRIAMPPEATEAGADLDIFVQDPTGASVASSTSGGTDELIDIPLPMDGTWTVWVHGWLAPGGDSDYNMWTWTVPLASGGSLSVDAAPATATLGTVGTIDISWSGLTSGAITDWYLGAVSHTGDVGLMGLTLVNVDNR